MFSRLLFKTRKKQGLVLERVNPLLGDKTLAFINLKAFADENLNMAHMLEFFIDIVENTVRK